MLGERQQGGVEQPEQLEALRSGRELQTAKREPDLRSALEQMKTGAPQ